MVKIKKCFKGCYDVFFNNQNIFEIINVNNEGKVFNYSLWNVKHEKTTSKIIKSIP
jgi:hypothetical protein